MSSREIAEEARRLGTRAGALLGRHGLEEIAGAVERQLRVRNHKSFGQRSAQQNDRRSAPHRGVLHEARPRGALLEFAQPIRHVVLAAKIRQPLEFSRAGRRDQHLFAAVSRFAPRQKCLHLSVIARCRLHLKRARLLSPRRSANCSRIALRSMQSRLPLIFMLNDRRFAAFDFAAPAILIQSIAQGRSGEFERFGLIEHYQGVVAQFEEAVSAVRQRSAFCISSASIARYAGSIFASVE